MGLALSILVAALVAAVAYDYWVRFGGHFVGTAFLEPLKGYVYLTFDDGPASEVVVWGNSLLDAENARRAILAVDPAWDFMATTSANLARVLGEYDVRALFFVCGQILDADPAQWGRLRQLHRSGHILGNHSYSHTRYSELSAQKCLDELERTDSLLRAITGEAPTMFRPPWGHWHVGRTLRMWSRPSLRRYNLPTLWSHYTPDWGKSPSDLSRDELDKRAAEVVQQMRGTECGVVLLQHDVWIYAVLFTRLLLERIRHEPTLRIGEPVALVRHVTQVSSAAKKSAALSYYFRARVRSIKARLRRGLAS